MRRRLEIARGVLHSPRVLFLDEPTTGLDPQSRRSIWDMFDDMRERDPELAIILTTHAMEEADYLCDRIAIMDQGKVLCEDTPAGAEARPRVGRARRARHRPRDRGRGPRGDRRRPARRNRGSSRGTCVHFTAKPGEGVGRRIARLLEDRGYHIVHLNDLARHARGRLLLLHRTGAARGMKRAAERAAAGARARGSRSSAWPRSGSARS